MKLKRTLLLASTALLLTGCGTGTEYEPVVNYIKENGNAEESYKIYLNEEETASIRYNDNYEGKFIEFEAKYTYDGKLEDFEGVFVGQVRESDEGSYTGYYRCTPKGAFQILGRYESWGFFKTKKHELDTYTYLETNEQTYHNDFNEEMTPIVKQKEKEAVTETLKLVNTWLKSKDLPYIF